LVGVSDTGTQKVINNAKKAEMHGADAVVALPPFYYKLDQEAVYSFVKEVSQALNIPLLLYANYAQTGVSITFDTFRLISQLDNISGVKYSDSDMLTMVRLIKELKRPNFSILVGNEWLFGSAAMARVSGLVGGVTTLIPDVIKNLLEAAKRGEGSRVDQFQKIINKLLEPLTEAWVHEVKYALKLMGIFTEDRPCSPYIPIKPERKTVIMNVLKDIKLI
ncbi:MAG: dihydrodipicolinate synthase family protein, partial [Candidatus Bathyarchaeia archaeon]